MPRLPKRTWICVTMAVAAAVVVLGLVTYLATRSAPAPSMIGPFPITPDLADISATIGIDLPDSARLRKSAFTYEGNEGEGYGWAEIMVDSASVDGLMKAVRHAGVKLSEGFRMKPMITPGAAAFGARPPDWWRPARMTKGIGGSSTSEPFGVFISQAGGSQPIVYLQWLEWAPSLPLPFNKRDYDLKQFASATGLRFPASARLARSLVLLQDSINAFGWAQVVIDAQDVGPFRTGAARGFETEFTKEFRMTHLTPGTRASTGVEPPSWWRPEAVKDGVGGWAVPSERYGYVEVLIGRPAEGHATLYIQWTKAWSGG